MTTWTTKLQRFEDEVYLEFPEGFLKTVGWKEGDFLDLEVVDGKLHIVAVPKPILSMK